jgi:hypothetical protein
MHGAPAGSAAQGVADGLPATNCQITNNLWVRCAQLRLGYESRKRPLPPRQCLFADNVVCETDDERLLRLYQADGIEFRGNYLYASNGKETGIESLGFPAAAFRVVNPRLQEQGELWLPDADAPVSDVVWRTANPLKRDEVGPAS